METGTAPSRRVLLVVEGRGRTGKSTMADFLIQEAREAGRLVIVADGDRRNPTLATLYPPGREGGATQPRSDDGADVKDWITDTVGQMAQTGASLVLDLTGGDRAIQEHSREFGDDFGLAQFCERYGFTSVGVYTTGPDPDDFEHILSIRRARYFRPDRAALVMNAALVRAGKNAAGEFEAIRNDSRLKALEGEGVALMFMPALACMGHMRAAGLTFGEAEARTVGRDGKPFDAMRAFMVEGWRKGMRERLGKLGLAETLP